MSATWLKTFVNMVVLDNMKVFTLHVNKIFCWIYLKYPAFCWRTRVRWTVEMSTRVDNMRLFSADVFEIRQVKTRKKTIARRQHGCQLCWIAVLVKKGNRWGIQLQQWWDKIGLPITQQPNHCANQTHRGVGPGPQHDEWQQVLNTCLLCFDSGGIPTTVESQGFKHIPGNLREEGNWFQLIGNVTIKDSHQQLAHVANQGHVNTKESSFTVLHVDLDFTIWWTPPGTGLPTWFSINQLLDNKMIKKLFKRPSNRPRLVWDTNKGKLTPCGTTPQHGWKSTLLRIATEEKLQAFAVDFQQEVDHAQRSTVSFCQCDLQQKIKLRGRVKVQHGHHNSAVQHQGLEPSLEL